MFGSISVRISLGEELGTLRGYTSLQDIIKLFSKMTELIYTPTNFYNPYQLWLVHTEDFNVCLLTIIKWCFIIVLKLNLVTWFYFDLCLFVF